MKKEEDNRRIKLRTDFFKKNAICDDVDNFVLIANERVIPLMRELGLKITKEDVIWYAEDSDRMKDIFIQSEKDSSGLDNSYLLGMVEREAAEKFNELFLTNPYDDTRTRYPDTLKLEKGRFAVDSNAIEEAATIYIEGAELDAYDRHIKAVEALNEFFCGKAPDSPISLFNYFPIIDGIVRAGKDLVSYSQFINPKNQEK